MVKRISTSYGTQPFTEFYRKHGFKLMPNKDELLGKYWNVPQRQVGTSVVLGIEV